MLPWKSSDLRPLISDLAHTELQWGHGDVAVEVMSSLIPSCNFDSAVPERLPDPSYPARLMTWSTQTL
jgi:hypothetical protein